MDKKSMFTQAAKNELLICFSLFSNRLVEKNEGDMWRIYKLYKQNVLVGIGAQSCLK